MDFLWQLNTYRWILQDGYDVETGEHISVQVKTMGLVVHTMGGFDQYKVPEIPDRLLVEWIEQRAGILARAFEHGELPARGLNPETAAFCTDWCPVRAECLRRG